MIQGDLIPIARVPDSVQDSDPFKTKEVEEFGLRNPRDASAARSNYNCRIAGGFFVIRSFRACLSSDGQTGRLSLC
jgi:hypothetical protein